MSSQEHDYSIGEPRHHHEFYIEDGNITIQVENAVFKVHRYHLAQRSSVLKDLFQTPQQEGGQDGTDAKPLVLSGDTVIGWVVLFRSIYSTKLLKSELNFRNDDLVALLHVAHKYCMSDIEDEIVSHLELPTDKEGYIQLVYVSKLVGSDALRTQAIQGLIPYRSSLTLIEATKIGLETLYAIMQSPPDVNSCNCGRRLGTYCGGCKKWLVMYT